MGIIDAIDDTIAAISTSTGQGGIGIVRISGNQALSIADEIFQAKTGQKPSAVKGYTVLYGNVVRTREKSIQVIDEALLTVMRSPKSYTTEDVVEISSHGGIVSLKSILDLVLEAGARLAEPGEFTKRAFLNGRIDLAQAEAVLDIIQAKTEAFLHVSTNQLKGELSHELEKNRELLMSVYAQIEAVINFLEDMLGSQEQDSIRHRLNQVLSNVEKLLSSSDHGRILKEGIKVVICGKPNVGKSSLLNILLRTPRAIISDIAGTTRDTIEETAQIRGIPFQLVDTAGILEPRDLIEEEAIKRSHMNIQSADLVLLLLDASQTMTQEDVNFVYEVKNKNKLLVLNKCDLDSQILKSDVEKNFKGTPAIEVSALMRAGIDQLEELIVEHVWQGKTVETNGILVSNVRHVRALKECAEHIKNSLQALDEKISVEFVSEDIKSAVTSLDKITGRDIDADLLENIFSQFCVGK